MLHFLEKLLGLDAGFLHRPGDLSIQFNPAWPGQQIFGAGVWNFVLAVVAILLVAYVYRHEARSRTARLLLGALRLCLLAFLIMLLNLPVITLTHPRSEPSVLGIVIDDTMSMRVKDAGPTAATPESRMEAVISLLDSDNAKLIRELSKKHQLKLFRFEQSEHPLASIIGRQELPGMTLPPATPAEKASFEADIKSTVGALDAVKPDGGSTQVVTSLRQVMEDLQGQRVAGIVLLTDGRDTPSESLTEGLAAVKNFGVKVYPVAVGSKDEPRNIEIQTVDVQDSAFVGDIVNVKAVVHVSGYGRNHPIHVKLKNKKTGALLVGPDGRDVEMTVNIDSDQPQEIELPFKASEIGTMDVTVDIDKQAGQLDDAGNTRTVQLAVLDAKINVLYVDGYPRWDYRYVKTEMIREPTINVSCLLLSADPGVPQEHSKPGKDTGLKYFPYRIFPETMEQLMECDVVIFGDVNPLQFTDSQLQLVSDFVSKKGGGFGMVAGPKFSPQAFHNTPIEAVLPVTFSSNTPIETGSITQGFRPVVTKVGADSSIFRFFVDKARNEKYLTEDWQPLFWYCQGITVKPGVGEVYLEHPHDIGPDGRKAPLLVLGRFGAGRTLFSAFDDSWRWRFYTGESIFNTYWVQQLRYLARSKKLGERRMTFASERPSYESGEEIRLNARVLDGKLLSQLPEQFAVELLDADGVVVRRENMVRQPGSLDLYSAAFTADHTGKFTARLPSVAVGVNDMTVPLEVTVPRLELSQPQVDTTLLSRIAAETLGEMIPLKDAAAELPSKIASAGVVVPDITSRPLWDAPLALFIFVLLITVEWILRKVYGLL